MQSFFKSTPPPYFASPLYTPLGGDGGWAVHSDEQDDVRWMSLVGCHWISSRPQSFLLGLAA